jgi:electron transport complex protein RnfC
VSKLYIFLLAKGGLFFVKGTHLFPGGIHPGECVNGKMVTGAQPIQVLPPPSRVILPLQQHIGVPCKCVVKQGDYVKIGQIIGEAAGFVSAPVHATVSGTVVAVAPSMTASGLNTQAVVIDNDFRENWVPLTPAANQDQLTAKEITEIIRNAGIVGLGGATFPTAVKLSPPPEKKVDTLIVNGAECEPYLSSDHRLMLEHGAVVMDGVALVKKALGISRVIIGIENNKADAVEVMRDKAGKMEGVTVRALPVRYPQGGEKQLIYSLTRRVVPMGGLPADVGVICMNVGTLAAVSQAVREGRPVVDRVATVGGLVEKPGNFLTRIGTTVGSLVEAAGGFQKGVRKFIYGGPMMGHAISRLDIPVTKSCSGILALGEEAVEPPESNCIRCGRCSRACPMLLMPFLLNQYSRADKHDEAEKASVMNCIECGCCTYVCPAKIRLVQSLRVSKKFIAEKRSRAAKKGER